MKKNHGAEEKPGGKGDLIWASSLGIHLVLSTAVGLILGWYLDKWFKTAPVLTIVFFFIGTFAGFRQIYLEIKKLGENDKKNALGEK